MNPSAVPNNWWTSFYEELPLESFMERGNTQELDHTLAFLFDKLGLRPGMTVFDQCCGTGEVSVPLARRGIEIIGVDLCQKFIKIAKDRAAESDLPCQYFCGDAFTFVPEHYCDAAFNWWTSFGYATEDATNKMMLERAFQSLKPGGTFVLDYPNLTGMARSFEPRTFKFHETQYGGAVVIRETKLDLLRGLRQQLWTYLLPNGRRRVHNTAIKIYMPNAVVEMLQQCGFEDIQLFGGLLSEPLELDSQRCMFVARRPR